MITFISAFTFSDIIALLALIVSGWAVYSTRRSAKIEEKLNMLLVEKEQSEVVVSKRADLGARLLRVGGSKYRLKIYNQGKAVARDISIDFPEGNDFVPQGDILSKFPLEALNPMDSVDLVATHGIGMRSKWPVKITWSDEHSDENEVTSYVTL